MAKKADTYVEVPSDDVDSSFLKSWSLEVGWRHNWRGKFFIWIEKNQWNSSFLIWNNKRLLFNFNLCACLLNCQYIEHLILWTKLIISELWLALLGWAVLPRVCWFYCINIAFLFTYAIYDNLFIILDCMLYCYFVGCKLFPVNKKNLIKLTALFNLAAVCWI